MHFQEPVFPQISGRIPEHAALSLHVTKAHIFRAGHEKTLAINRGTVKKTASGKPRTAKRTHNLHFCRGTTK